MTSLQKVVCVFLSLCFFAILILVPESFIPDEDIYRQLPLYCFLESSGNNRIYGSDEETQDRLLQANAAYLTSLVQAEGGQELSDSLEDVDNTADVTEKTDVTEITDGTEKTDVTEITDGTETDDIADTGENQMKRSTRPSHWIHGNTEAAETAVQPQPMIDLSPEKLKDSDYLLNQFFIEDSNVSVRDGLLDAETFLEEDLALELDVSEPQILIYHSHASETFADSRQGEQEDTIVGVGSYLAEILTETYGYSVAHVTETFDMMSGELDRSLAYDYAREYLEEYLKENPSVEVIIDLHRDGIPEDRHLVTEINGKQTAQIMFYNGLSSTVSQGEISYLPNPYIEENLAFSFQLEYQAALYYPDFYRGIYLAGLRYNLHFRPRSLLLEAGAQTNTLQEVKNAMEPFADILNRVLKGQ